MSGRQRLRAWDAAEPLQQEQYTALLLCPHISSKHPHSSSCLGQNPGPSLSPRAMLSSVCKLDLEHAHLVLSPLPLSWSNPHHLSRGFYKVPKCSPSPHSLPSLPPGCASGRISPVFLLSCSGPSLAPHHLRIQTRGWRRMCELTPTCSTPPPPTLLAAPATPALFLVLQGPLSSAPPPPGSQKASRPLGRTI